MPYAVASEVAIVREKGVLRPSQALTGNILLTATRPTVVLGRLVCYMKEKRV